MFLKSFGILTPVALGGMYVSGALGGGYTRDIGQPMAQVMDAVADADLRDQPGSPGTDASQAGGVLPLFGSARSADRIVWTVRSGDKVAMTMTASFAPIRDGAGTRVTTSVESGDADPDFVSPLFRSEAMTAGVFTAMIESELNDLTAAKSRQAAGNAPAGADRRTFGEGIGTIMKVNAMHGEYQRTGKMPEGPYGMLEQEAPGDGQSTGSGGVKFEPGQPMVDVKR